MGASGRYTNYRRQQSTQTIADSTINGHLREKLRDYNQRDAEAINRHIRTLRDALEQRDDDAVVTRLGGSVIRHTYVNGLSDIDVLMIVNDSSLSGRPPNATIQHMANLIRQRLPNTTVETGDMAVTIKYSDGNEVQVLPAIKTSSGVRVADPGRNQWSNVVHPERFAQKLTQVNQANDGQVIPAIKLTKAMADRIIRSDRDKISGYHVESLAIEAFRNYSGPTDLKSMVSHLCSFSSGAVRNPINDPTGQSRHVDGYMEEQGSSRRQRAAGNFKNIERRLNDVRSQSDLESLL